MSRLQTESRRNTHAGICNCKCSAQVSALELAGFFGESLDGVRCGLVENDDPSAFRPFRPSTIDVVHPAVVYGAFTRD